MSPPLLLLATPAAAWQTDQQPWLQVNAAVTIDPQDKITPESIGRFSDRADGFFHAEIGGLFTRETNQYRFGRDGRRDQMDRVATFTLSFNIAPHRRGRTEPAGATAVMAKLSEIKIR